MSAKLNIFMVGGRRCGKTTVLSKIYRQFNNVLHHGPDEEVKDDLFRINLDATDIPHVREAEDAIHTIFRENDACDEFIVEDYNPSKSMTEIKFNMSPIDGGQSLKIGFRDIPGEWCNGKVLNDSGVPVDNIVTAVGVNGKQETKNAIEFVVDYIQYSTVTIIAIDTPAMMEEHGAFNNTINRIGPITEAFKTALQNTGGDENKSDKLILFVPLKCEKYVVKRDGAIDNKGMESVAKKVRESYAELISIISENPLKDSVSAAILPIVTIKEVRWFKYGCYWEDKKNSIFNDKGNLRSFPEYYDPKNLVYSYFGFRNDTLHGNALKNGSDSEFCEQPLVYSLVYSMRHAIYRTAHPAVSPKGGPIAIAIKIMLALLHGFLVNNKAFESEANRLSGKKLKRGNGFLIIQDERRFLG